MLSKQPHRFRKFAELAGFLCKSTQIFVKFSYVVLFISHFFYQKACGGKYIRLTLRPDLFEVSEHINLNNKKTPDISLIAFNNKKL
jgi:hypothetical protein